MNDLTGHNLPPEAEATFDQLQARASALVENANRWANERPEIRNEEEAERAGDFLDQLRRLGADKNGQIDKARLAEQAPHTEAVAEIRERYGPVKRVVELSMKLMKGKLTVWLDKQEAIKEQERQRAEAEARKTQEEATRSETEVEKGTGDVIGDTLRAEQAKDRAVQADRAVRRAQAGATVASAYGGRSKSLRRRTVVEIEDATKIPAKFLRRLCANAYVTEALQRAVRADPKTYEGVPGISIREERSAA